MDTNTSLRMSDKMKISFNRPYHIFTEQKSFSNINTYKKFLNWVSGEFDLNLQDESDTLKVFFPTKRLTIKRKQSNSDIILFEINIESRVIHDGFKLKEKIEMIYQNLSKMVS